MKVWNLENTEIGKLGFSNQVGFTVCCQAKWFLTMACSKRFENWKTQNSRKKVQNRENRSESCMKWKNDEQKSVEQNILVGIQ